MTQAQERKIEYLKKAMETEFVSDKKKFEFKEVRVTEYERFVAIYMETGLKEDEGTLAQVFCRDHVHLFVGPRGGVTYYKPGCKTKTTFHSIWMAAYNQKYD